MRRVHAAVAVIAATVVACPATARKGEEHKPAKAGVAAQQVRENPGWTAVQAKIASRCEVWLSDFQRKNAWSEAAAPFKLGPKVAVLSLVYMALGLLCAGLYLVLLTPAHRQTGAIILLLFPLPLVGSIIVNDALSRLGAALITVVVQPTEASETSTRTPEDAAKWQEAWKQYEYGDYLYNHGRYADALMRYSSAIAIHEGHFRSYYMRGVTYQDLGKHKEALADYNNSIKFGPKWAPAWQNRAALLYQYKDYKQALADATRAYELYAGSGKKRDAAHMQDFIATIKREMKGSR